MSLITTCPACGTAFHVEPAQLAVHRGDVGCGRCGHVFNALERLSEIEPETPAAALAPEIEAEPEPTADPAPDAAPAVVPEAQMPGPGEQLPSPTLPSEPPAPPPVRLPPAPEAEATPLYLHGTEVPPVPPVEPPAWRRQATRWLLPPLAMLLLLAAVAQGAYFLRSDLAIWLPQLRPVLEQACAQLGCRIELPRREQLLSIDDSDLHKDDAHDGVYVLSATIRNLARHVQAYPLLELTLTELDDRPVLRRTLSPREYLPSSTDIGTGFAAGSELNVRLTFALEGVSATGYRVFVTYP